ncbi:GDSL-type esterase/lipase family protein [cf. Phormidesmis sp. LEGE 11477]|uniref:GDSL-type esterase/lipase family protein n=1 Tax=cf. Phormidesmis sp. LEGE 11477 TaxID=1828680 RepID=UPI00188235BA|nr:GDSL-type esterase/lipase family protein [cf. Phormidesmis sp. LEGE 11477]MBE9063994.1 G-D-S-L family lipolytic protein [cf. Phormidesmis sp. LEGE 11477]
MAATLPPVHSDTIQTDLKQRISAQPQVQIRTHPKKVIVMGDSLVYGYGDSEGGGWVERLRRDYLDPQQTGPIFYNLGIRGNGVAQVAERLQREFCDRGELRHRTPDLLVLSVGVNDCARAGRVNGRPVSDPDSFAQSLEQLLTQSRQLCPVLFIGMVPINEAAMPFANVLYFSRTEQQRYSQITRQLCEAHQIPYLDLFERWSQKSEAWQCDRLCTDGIHPNSLGYRTILETVKAWQPFVQELDSFHPVHSF